ncbi:MAG TPA: GNAT family N-acetyltransferase [Jatrophihabitans sp.]|jgi:ribosomal protein S18 acetylase RimI-like enzyme|uniref:GNAT family N-acetyltransferase n=1 Tax=Jatrophihabitans sp. TaxID=1932789 RepID=UPI002EF9531D
MTGRRSRYRSAGLLTGLIILGWIWDFVLGGGRTHSPAWLGALIVVGGISLLAARGAPDSAFADPAPADRTPAAGPAAVRPIVIAPADSADLPQLVEIEVAADKLFEVAGYGSTPGPATTDELAGAKLLLVARRQPSAPAARDPRPSDPRPSDPGPSDPRPSDPEPSEPAATGQPPIGYIRVEVVDGQAHIEGLSVRPKEMRRGVGAALVNAACEWAAEQGFNQVTLCTFADVPWNGPFYAGLGFTEIPAATPELQALRRRETRLGLDAMGRRCVMRRPLDRPPSRPSWPAG